MPTALGRKDGKYPSNNRGQNGSRRGQERHEPTAPIALFNYRFDPNRISVIRDARLYLGHVAYHRSLQGGRFSDSCSMSNCLCVGFPTTVHKPVVNKIARILVVLAEMAT